MDRVNRHRQWLPEETESPAATPLSSADMWREPKMPRGEISKPEVEVLNLWRRLPDKLKRVAYSQMQTLMLARRHGPHRSVMGRRLDGLCLELGSAGTV